MLHPDSGCFLILQVNTRERYREGGNVSLKNLSSWKRRGKQKEAKCDGKAATGFSLACSS
jgi:hypothetical protein